jgi:dTDP-4-dehydrorhamnose 3,5-epimerase
VHISSEYVFDGTQSHSEDEPFSPLSVYGASKAAGDIAASSVDKHYIVRTSWVIGDGKNFVRTMLMLAEKGIKPTVVSDQIGRLTFTSTLVDAIDHLLATATTHGTYNVSNDGPIVSWASIAAQVFSLSGHAADDVSPTTTAAYFEDKPAAAKRPLDSALDLTKITSAGYSPTNWQQNLAEYIASNK